MTDKIPIHRGGSNVFADLGIEDADEYLAKSEFAAHILKIVLDRGLTQAEAGKLLGISQPKVSELLNGRLDGITTDRLFRFLNKLGCDIQIKILKPHPETRGQVLVMAK